MGRRGQTLDFQTLVSPLSLFQAPAIPLRNKMGTDPAFPAHSIQFGI